MSSFREHCAFGFWKGALIVDGNGRNAEAMGQFGRLTKVADLPSRKVLTGYIRKAMALNDEGVAVARPGRATKAPLVRQSQRWRKASRGTGSTRRDRNCRGGVNDDRP